MATEVVGPGRAAARAAVEAPAVVPEEAAAREREAESEAEAEAEAVPAQDRAIVSRRPGLVVPFDCSA